MFVDLSIDPQKVTGKIIFFIKSSLKDSGFKKLIVGLSGGIDSAVSCALAVRAIGAGNIHLGLFPYGDLNIQGAEDGRLLSQFLQIPSNNLHLIDIQSMVDEIVKHDPSMDKLRKGNIAVRVRMILLFDLAKKLEALVLGTENRTEYLLGYFTRFGDEASDIEPIVGLYKTQVRQLAQFLKIPGQIIAKLPTAGMWQGQTDEGEFGFTYSQADQILSLSFDNKLTAKEIEKQGFSKETIRQVLKRVEENKFKHDLPLTLE